MKVGKIFEISYGHRILNHPGKCRRVHGHNGKIEILIGGSIDSSTGMVVDFEEITLGIVKLIKDTFDHKMILQFGDPLTEALDIEEVILLEKPPTAEVLADIICRRSLDYFGLNTRIIVRFWETSSCYAEADSSIDSMRQLIMEDIQEVGITR